MDVEKKRKKENKNNGESQTVEPMGDCALLCHLADSCCGIAHHMATYSGMYVAFKEGTVPGLQQEGFCTQTEENNTVANWSCT